MMASLGGLNQQRDLDQTVVEGGHAPHVSQTLTGQFVGADVVGCELLPPSRQTDDYAALRTVGYVGARLHDAAIAEDADKLAIDGAACIHVVGMNIEMWFAFGTV